MPDPKASTASDYSRPRTYVLSDAATSIDLFGSHSRVAQAIATLIRNGSPAGRSIALTGSWGSGKSSVIEMLRTRLGALTDPASFAPRIFVFDAWAHQGDPIRRSFLECLIREAVKLCPEAESEIVPDEPKADPPRTYRKYWTEELDRITGRREVNTSIAKRPLTKWGFALAASVLLGFPMGASFLGRYDPAKVPFWSSNFGLMAAACFALPVAIALAALLKERDFESLKALMLREARQDTTTTTVKTRDPSSVDFRDLFTHILSYIMKPAERRLVVIVDNLDRIDAETAVSMWATMRVFFELEGGNDSWSERLWLIVPFDRSALRKLWTVVSDESQSGTAEAASAQAAGDALIDSFLNKTFQIAFPVSPPVLTKWKSYFLERLCEIFADGDLERDRTFVYRLYSLLGPVAPSPREIKSFINKLSALHLLWSGADKADERIALPFLAAYLLVSTRMGDDGQALIEGDILGADATNLLSRYDPSVDWREKLAAVHFNVPPAEAIQVLLGPRILRAIETGNMTEMEQLQSRPYFWTVFDRKAADQHGEWIGRPAAVSNAARFLEKAAPDSENAGIFENIRQNVIGTACEVTDWVMLDGSPPPSVVPILNMTAKNDSDFERIASRVLDSLSTSHRALKDAQQGSFNSWIEVMVETFSAIARHPRGSSLTGRFRTIHLDIVPFLRAHLAAARNPEGERLVRYLECMSPSSIPVNLAALLPESKEEEFLRVKAALQQQWPDGWETYDLAVVDALDKLPAERLALAVRSIWGNRAGRPIAQEVSEKLRAAAWDALPGMEKEARWREAGLMAAAVYLSAIETKIHSAIEDGSINPELMAATTDALLELGFSSEIYGHTRSQRSFLTNLLARNRFEDLDPERVVSAYRHHRSEARQQLLALAAGSERFFEHFISPTVEIEVGDTESEFLAAWMKLLPPAQRERMALRIAMDMAVWPPDSIEQKAAFVNAVIETCGTAWMPLDVAESLYRSAELAAKAESSAPGEGFRSLKDQLANRIDLGDRTVDDLIKEADRAPVDGRGRLLSLAIDRAHGDVVIAGTDSPGALNGWGRALLAQCRYIPPSAAMPFLDRAYELFEKTHTLQPSAQTAAGLAESLERLSQWDPDGEALTRLNRAVQMLEAALAQTPDDPVCLHALGAVHISRARRVTAPEERDAELLRAQRYLEAIAEPKSPRALLVLAVSLTERGMRCQPVDESHFDQAAACAERIIDLNPNAAYGYRQAGVILMRRAEKMPWRVAETLLREARERLDEALSRDPKDYSVLCFSGDAIMSLARNRIREESKELAAIATEKYQLAQRLDPNWPNAFAGAGWAALLAARRSTNAADFASAADAAIRYADRALEMRPDSVPALRILGNARLLQALRAARTEADALAHNAFDHFRRAAELRPDETATRVDWSLALTAYGNRRQRSDYLAEGLKVALEAVRVAPDNAHANAAVAEARRHEAYLKEGDEQIVALRSAMVGYHETLAMSPDLDYALVGFAHAKARLAERVQPPERNDLLMEAEAHCEHALELRADNEYALEALGDIDYRRAHSKGDSPETERLRSAVERYDRARGINPDLLHSHIRSAQVRLDLARPYRDRDLAGAAVESLRETVKLFPDHARAHASLGSALRTFADWHYVSADKRARLKESAAALRQAASIAPSEFAKAELRLALLDLAESSEPSEADQLRLEARGLEVTPQLGPSSPQPPAA